MISFRNVSKSYLAGEGGPSFVLRNVDFEVDKGQFLCILGPSGCGKTTLLNLAAGFISATEGCVLLDGKEIAGPGAERGVVFQDANLFPWLTVRKNVEFGLKLQGIRGEELYERALECLEMTGMADHAGKYPHALSGGMRQRVAIARILALNPQVMLMDEPFSALDENTRERLQDDLLLNWSGGARTTVYITHSVDEAAYLADRVIIMGGCKEGVHADVVVDREGPPERSASEFLSLKAELRAYLSQLPCCIPR